MPQTILLTHSDVSGIRKEAVAGGAITPGFLLERSSATAVVAHNSAGANAQPLFALENDLVGEDISDAYASGDTVQMIYAHRGAEIYAWLADGETASVGDYLQSDGDGALAVLVGVSTSDSGVTIAPAQAVAVALEAKSPSGADARIKVEVL